MDLIQKQRALRRFLSTLLVIGVFAKNAGAAAQFDASDNLIALDDVYYHLESDENPEHSIFIEAAKLSKSLATRTHTRIATVYDALMTEDQLKGEIDDLYRDRVKYVQRIRDEYKHSLDDRQQTIKEYAASNAATVNSAFDHTLGNEENKADHLNAQIIRHHLNAPMKVIQSLLSLAAAQHSQGEHPRKQMKEQLKYKARVFKEVLVDFDYLLRQESTKMVELKRAMDILMDLINDMLTSERVPLIRIMKRLSTDWANMQNVIEDEKRKADDQEHIIDLLNRMLSLRKCAEFGIAAYRQCRYNPAKLAAFGAHVDEFKAELKQWKEFEQTTYGVVIPILKEIERSSDDEHAADFDNFVLSFLPKLGNVLMKMQQRSLHSNDLNRVAEDTKQLVRMTESLYNHHHIHGERTKLATLVQKIQKIGTDVPAEIKTVDGFITANLMLESCRMGREALKLGIMPFDQDYLVLCDMPAIPDKSKASELIKRNVLKNIEELKRKIRDNNKRRRPQDSVSYTLGLSSDPIYEWKSKDFKNEITKLLKGEKIILNSDFSALESDRNVVRTKQILLDFAFANEAKQKQFYDAIKGYTVELTMTGNNHFRCDKRIFYVPTGANFHFRYVVGRMDDKHTGNSVIFGNELYNEVMKREAYLALLTTWELQLVKPSSESGNLQNFIGDNIDLQLKGAIRYVDNYGLGRRICNDRELKKNYRLDRILSDE